MVKKIKKKVQRGPKALFAIPLAMAMTALYGTRRQGKDFRRAFEPLDLLRKGLQLHLEEELIIADRPLSAEEYAGWGFRSKPARLAEMFSKSGVIPMGPPIGAVGESDPESSPRLGVFPMIALVQEKALGAFSSRLSEEFSELSRVAFQNAVFPALHLIPGYDLLLYLPPCPAQALNHAIESVNVMLREAFERESIPFPGPFDLFPESALADIPIKETCFK
ncbi:MAG TPA: hypothetical protein VIK48_00785 [Candidatus Manganitrophaceae bacterium]